MGMLIIRQEVELRLISGQYETWQAWGAGGDIWCVIMENLHHADSHVLLALCCDKLHDLVE